ncbi:hypothetical protein [Mariprofundus ferrooxydans]|nr:hypothetical protein [Mariprofundus ferrooxydans]
MATAFHIKDRKEHLNFIPEEYRNEVKIVLLTSLGLACLNLLFLLS